MGQSGPMRIPAPGDALPWRGDGSTRPPAAAGPVPPAADAARARRPPAQALALRRGLRRGPHAAAPASCRWPGCRRRSGRCGTGARACCASARASAPVAAARAARSSCPTARVRVRDRGVAIDLALEPAGDVVEVVSRHGGATIWTRKRPVVARGAVVLDGRRTAVAAPGLVDDSAGLARAAHGMGLVRGRRAGGRRAGGRVEPRRGRARRAGAQRADGVGRRRRAGGGAGRVRRALDTVGGLRFAAEAERAPSRPRGLRPPRERVPPAVRRVLRHAARRNRAGGRPGCHGAPSRTLVSAAKRVPTTHRSR